MVKIAIIGGGPAGVFCAILLKNLIKQSFESVYSNGGHPHAGEDIDVTIFEKNEILKTILPTGGGRCNLAHAIYDFKELASNYPRGEKFLYSVFLRFGTSETLQYFKKLGIETYTQSDNRIFPVSDSSAQVRNTLIKALNNVKTVQKEISSADELKGFNYVVIAGGSKGAYRLAQDFGHTITALKPSLCGFVTDKIFHAGIVLKNVRIIDVDTKADYMGEILFTHKGISGPLIYQISSINAYRNFPYALEVKIINEDAIKKEIKNRPKRDFMNIVGNFVPKTLARDVISAQLGIEFCQKQGAHITKEELKNVCTLTLKVKATVKDRETVTAGGVCLDEINSKNCKSKIVPNLYFCGEIMDIDGFCGGFNLQACWSEAFCVASDIAQSLTR